MNTPVRPNTILLRDADDHGDRRPALPLASNPEAYLKRAKEHAASFTTNARVVDIGGDRSGGGILVHGADKNGAVGVRWDGSNDVELWNPLHLREVLWVPGDRVIDRSAARKGLGTVRDTPAGLGRVYVMFDSDNHVVPWDESFLRPADPQLYPPPREMSGGTPATQEEPPPGRRAGLSKPVWALVIKDVEERADLYGQQSGQGWRSLAEDMRARDAEGTKKYGTPLHTHNGRRPIVDCYQEVLDACVYMKQAIVEVEDDTKKAALRATYVTLLDTAKFLRGAVGYVDSPAAQVASPTVDAWIESQEAKHEAWRARQEIGSKVDLLHQDALGDLHTRPRETETERSLRANGFGDLVDESQEAERADVDDEMTGQPVPHPAVVVAQDALALAQRALDETAEQSAMLQELRTIVTETMGKNADALVEMTKKYLVAEEKATAAEQATDRLADLGKALQTKELEAQELSAGLATANALMQHHAQEALDLRQSLKVAVTRENEALDKLQAANDLGQHYAHRVEVWAKKFDEVVQAKTLVVTEMNELARRLNEVLLTKTSVVAECETLGRANVSLNDRVAQLEALLQRENDEQPDTLEERVRMALDEAVGRSDGRSAAKSAISAVFAAVRAEVGL